MVVLVAISSVFAALPPAPIEFQNLAKDVLVLAVALGVVGSAVLVLFGVYAGVRIGMPHEEHHLAGREGLKRAFIGLLAIEVVLLLFAGAAAFLANLFSNVFPGS